MIKVAFKCYLIVSGRVPVIWLGVQSSLIVRVSKHYPIGTMTAGGRKAVIRQFLSSQQALVKKSHISHVKLSHESSRSRHVVIMRL